VIEFEAVIIFITNFYGVGREIALEGGEIVPKVLQKL